MPQISELGEFCSEYQNIAICLPSVERTAINLTSQADATENVNENCCFSQKNVLEFFF